MAEAGRDSARWKRDDVAATLVIALGVVVLDKLADDLAQGALAERDDMPQALVLDRPNEPLGEGVGAHCQMHPMRAERCDVSG